MDTFTSPSYFGFAPLKDQQLSELRAVEEDLRVVVLALKPSAPLASLTPEQVSRLQHFEQKHGVIALAC
jgi:hypothetical protein